MSIDNLFTGEEPNTNALQEASTYESLIPANVNNLVPKESYQSLRGRPQSGFTLIELLVVIGITSGLMAILMPALSKARDSANRIKCLSNIRSVGQITTTYAMDNKGNVNDNQSGVASRIEQVGFNTHPNVGPGFDHFVGGHSVPGNQLFGKTDIYWCPKDAQKMQQLTLNNHAGVLGDPVLVSFYKAGHSMASGTIGDKINVESKNWMDTASDKATWMERTLNHKTGANTLYGDSHGKFVKMDFDVETDQINAFLTADQN